MKSRLLKNLSANALQLVINQSAAFVAFYLLSANLNKSNFGQLNLVLAILLAAFNILSLGIDQVVIKKIAAGDDLPQLLSLYCLHVLLAGSLFYLALLTGYSFFGHTHNTYWLLLLIGIGKLMQFFSSPFKQIANGLERFRLLSCMSVVSNCARGLGLLIMAYFHAISLGHIVAIFIVADTAELFISFLLFKLYIHKSIVVKWNRAPYISLVRESIPQTGVVLITSALARFDWIFIGFTLPAARLAEYSFAYKIFEIATMPLLAIAPMLIPRFTRLFKNDDSGKPGLISLIKTEIAVAMLTVLLLNLCWSPIIDAVTAGKYGAVNKQTIFILSLCMPFLYINNFLWTILFAKGKLKIILHSFVITLLINVVGDIILIPLYKNQGAALAYLLSCIVQCVFYTNQAAITGFYKIWQTFLACTLSACITGFSCRYLITNVVVALPAAAIIYSAILIATRQIKPADKNLIRQFFEQ